MSQLPKVYKTYMKNDKADFNIRIVSSDEIPDSLLKAGQVTILVNREDLWRCAHKVHTDIQQGIDRKSTYYRYELKVLDNIEELSRYLDCNIIAPLPNLLTGETEIVIASARTEDIGLAAVKVMNVIESQSRNAIESTIALFALGAPSEYRYAVNALLERLFRPKRWSRPAQAFRPVDYCTSVSFEECGNKKADIDDSPLQVENRLHSRISAEDIQEVYENLPDRYSDLYEKRNPEAAKIVRFSLDMIDQPSLVALLLEAAKTDKGLLQKLQKAKQKMASKYGIRVKQWSQEQKKYFKDQYRYCLYLIDDRGNEIPIKFKNNPSYCIFMMYVLDRHTRGIKATSLDFKDNQDEFKRLYSSIFNEDNEKIEVFCREMIHRKANETGYVRKGRYDDYIKDINDTMDQMVGCPDSITLKVGRGQFLEIPPNHIEIDRDLPIFNFI